MSMLLTGLINRLLDVFYHSESSGRRGSFWEFIEESRELRWPNPGFNASSRKLSLLVFMGQCLMAGITIASFILQLNPTLLALPIPAHATDYLFYITYPGLVFLFLMYFRLYYTVKFEKFSFPDIAENMHSYAEILREYQESERDVSALSRDAMVRLHMKFRGVAEGLFRGEIETVFKVRAGDFFYRLTENNEFLAAPAKENISISKDYCYKFMEYLSALKRDKFEPRTIILTNISGKIPPRDFLDAFDKEVSPDSEAGKIKKSMLAIEGDPVKYWHELYKRCDKRGYRSLIRINVSSASRQAYGTILIASKSPFAFYRCPRSYINILLACADQLSFIFRDHARVILAGKKEKEK